MAYFDGVAAAEVTLPSAVESPHFVDVANGAAAAAPGPEAVPAHASEGAQPAEMETVLAHQAGLVGTVKATGQIGGEGRQDHSLQQGQTVAVASKTAAPDGEGEGMAAPWCEGRYLLDESETKCWILEEQGRAAVGVGTIAASSKKSLPVVPAAAGRLVSSPVFAISFPMRHEKLRN